jgi:O-antigen ligase
VTSDRDQWSNTFAGLLAVLLVGWAWYFGITTTKGITGTQWSLFALGAVWVLGFSFRAPWRQGSFWIPVLLGALILIQGWWMAWNAEGIYHTTLSELAPRMRPVPDAPGAFDLISSKIWMWRCTALLIVLLVALDLARKPNARNVMAHIISVHLILFCIYGLAIRAAGIEKIPGSDTNTGDYFFATFLYHGNAAAYLNLLWPIMAAQWMLSEEKSRAPLLRTLYRFGMLTVTPALFIHGSRAGSAIAGLMLLAWLILYRRFLIQFWLRGSRMLRGLVIILAVLMAIGVALSFDIGKTAGRYYSILSNARNIEKRLDAYEAQWVQIDSVPMLGVGPGCFKWTFPPYFKKVHGEWPEKFWRYAHQDYLQTVIEWGWAGATVWGALIFAPLIIMWLRILRGRLDGGQTAVYQQRAMVLGISAVMLHALGDFPLQMMAIQGPVMVFIGLLWSDSFSTQEPPDMAEVEL